MRQRTRYETPSTTFNRYAPNKATTKRLSICSDIDDNHRNWRQLTIFSHLAQDLVEFQTRPFNATTHVTLILSDLVSRHHQRLFINATICRIIITIIRMDGYDSRIRQLTITKQKYICANYLSSMVIFIYLFCRYVRLK